MLNLLVLSNYTWLKIKAKGRVSFKIASDVKPFYKPWYCQPRELIELIDLGVHFDIPTCPFLKIMDIPNGCNIEET